MGISIWLLERLSGFLKHLWRKTFGTQPSMQYRHDLYSTAVKEVCLSYRLQRLAYGVCACRTCCLTGSALVLQFVLQEGRLCYSEGPLREPFKRSVQVAKAGRPQAPTRRRGAGQVRPK